MLLLQAPSSLLNVTVVFFKEEDTDLSKIFTPVPRELKKEYEVLVTDGKFSWDDGKSTVENVNLNIKKVSVAKCK